ncbi:MAG: hypothetical protein LBG98_03590 [Puniceicoccales bacterium]|jgi:hypothetical protein|nr:hypothetical protein [Puniceicoccales bacterium]
MECKEFSFISTQWKSIGQVKKEKSREKSARDVGRTVYGMDVLLGVIEDIAVKQRFVIGEIQKSDGP